VKEQVLLAVREEFKWAALRENKGFELLFRADSLKDSHADDAKVGLPCSKLRVVDLHIKLQLAYTKALI
jgi:hypothetical protein